MSPKIVSPAVTVGTGHSMLEDADAAAREAVSAALAGRVPRDVDLVFVFPTIQYDPHAFLAAAREAAAPAAVVGCSSFGSFTTDTQAGRGCVAAFVPAGECSFGVAAVDEMGDDIFGSARAAAELALERAGGAHPHSALVVFSDGLAGDQREVLRGMYAVTGAMVPIIGGAAGESLALAHTNQFAPDGVMTNGVVAIGINSPHPIGVGVSHGWRPLGVPHIVTRAEGNVIFELDGRPATEVYFEERNEELLDYTGFAGKVMDHPLGLANSSGRYDVRHIMDRHPGDGLVMFGYVGEGAVVRVMESSGDRLVAAAKEAATQAIAELETPPRGALVFSCTARFAVLGDRISDEVRAVSDGLGGVPACGFFTYGEFARVSGSTGFHNATVAVLAL